MFRENEVRNGISLLDQYNPGWREKFNPDTLDIANAYECVLGQVYGSYMRGIHWLERVFELRGISTIEAAVAHGFTLYGDSDQDVLYPLLNATWKALVTPHIVEFIPPVVERELVLV